MAGPVSHSQKLLPLVVQLGFAGARNLFKDHDLDDSQRVALDQQVIDYLKGRLTTLKTDLKLDEPDGPDYFFCGISQMAIGADMLFARACQDLEIPHRVFLPQTRDEFLNAVSTSQTATRQGSDGTETTQPRPDFTDQQRSDAEALFDSGNVIQERVASESANRRERFQDTSLEILRVSDFIVCLQPVAPVGKAGGTSELIDRALVRRKKVLVITVQLDEGGKLKFDEQWPARADEQGSPEFIAPALPRMLVQSDGHDQVDSQNESVPGELLQVGPYLSALNVSVRDDAHRFQERFRRGALIVLGTHILATILATFGAMSHGADHSSGGHVDSSPVEIAMDDQKADAHENVTNGKEAPATESHGIPPAIPVVAELILLVWGLYTHHQLVDKQVNSGWAYNRLLRQISVSVDSIGKAHVYMGHLFLLPLPPDLRPLLRTLNVLHLKSTHANNTENWDEWRREYVENRIEPQIQWYGKSVKKHSQRLKAAHRGFHICSITAIIATLLHALPIGSAATLMGGLAIMLPVFAVAAVSLAAAWDVEALIHTYEETRVFLEDQVELLKQAASFQEYSTLLVETETRLLGETANWYSRRSFLNIN